MAAKQKLLLNEGDYILIYFEERIKDTNELINTNIEEVAKREKFVKEDANFDPILVILGKNFFNKSVEEEMIKMREITDEEIIIELPPEKAYGIKDPNKIKVINAKEFTKEGIIPRVAQRVKIRDMEGTILTISGGRVIVDFNHQLAGKTILYKIKFVKKIEDEKEKILELFARRIKGFDKNKVTVDIINDNILEIKVNEDILNVPNLQESIKFYILDLQELMPKFSTIKITIEKVIPKELKERIFQT